MTTELKNQEKIDSPVVENITQDSQEFTAPAAIDTPEEIPSAQPVGEHVEPDVSSEVAEAGVTAVSESTHAAAAEQDLSNTGVTVKHELSPPAEPSGLIQFPVTSAPPENQILHRPKFSPSESGDLKGFSKWVNTLRGMFRKNQAPQDTGAHNVIPMGRAATPPPTGAVPTPTQAAEFKKAA